MGLMEIFRRLLGTPAVEANPRDRRVGRVRASPAKRTLATKVVSSLPELPFATPGFFVTLIFFIGTPFIIKTGENQPVFAKFALVLGGAMSAGFCIRMAFYYKDRSYPRGPPRAQKGLLLLAGLICVYCVFVGMSRINGWSKGQVPRENLWIPAEERHRNPLLRYLTGPKHV